MKKYCTLLLLCVFLVHNSLAQEQNATGPVQQKVINALGDFFFLGRENIHAHFDKNVFVTYEEIGFKGYVFNRKNFSPSYNTSNIHGVLLNEQGEKLSEKLFFATNGTFSGGFKLDKKYPSGYYYVQFFTNWMNNFGEDESAVFRIEVINEDNPERPVKIPDNSVVNIDFQPEGGNFIKGISNSIGVRVSDCHGDPIAVTSVKIVDRENQPVSTVFLNKFGYGRFEMTPGSQTYKAVIEDDNLKSEAYLPAASTTGFNLQVNNFTLGDKTVVRISTTTEFAEEIRQNSYIIAINNDEKVSFFDVDFSNGKNEQTVSFRNSFLFDGINTIRLLDQNLTELASRTIFKFPEYATDASIKVSSGTESSIEFNGEIPYPNANLSLSVLPVNTRAVNSEYDIYGSLYLNPYLPGRIKDASYYFSKQNPTRQLDLDLLLLNQKTQKYQWNEIVSNPPKKAYDADFGLTIMGTIDKTIKDPKKHFVRIFSIPASIDETAEVNEKNAFYFHNLALSDSTSVNITLHSISDPKTSLGGKISAKILNGNRTYSKMFKPSDASCIRKFEKVSFELPLHDKNAIVLDNVSIEKAKPGKGLVNENKSGNWALRGYKIKESMYNIPLRRFIEQNGFNVTYDRTGQMIISGRRSNSLNANGTTVPIIYIDDVQQFSLQQLEYLRMDQLEEIYINAHYGFPGINRFEGIIKLYTKKARNFTPFEYNGNSTVYTVTDGFEKNYAFRNPKYLVSEGFDSLGIVDWIPNVTTDANGKFQFKIPATEKRDVMIVLEGTTPDGQLISKVMTVSLAQEK